ncbi:hypothetical protein VpaJT1_33 [Vibrio phage VpaJT_1]|nr:hypothetical protein VpaJT1_33 [Vibrio phage VpaJT_1]
MSKKGFGLILQSNSVNGRPSEIVYSYFKNCKIDGVYYHGTIVNGKRQISGWTKRFVTRVKYGL